MKFHKKIRAVNAKLSHMDGRTVMTKLLFAFHNFANASKNIVPVHAIRHVGKAAAQTPLPILYVGTGFRYKIPTNIISVAITHNAITSTTITLLLLLHLPQILLLSPLL
jgi:hypothetical protein